VDYTNSSGWIFGAERIDKAIKGSVEPRISVLVSNRELVAQELSRNKPDWLSPRTLSFSPAFSLITKSPQTIELKLRPWLAKPQPQYAPASFQGYPSTEVLNIDALVEPEVMLEGFCRGLLAVLPSAFGDEPRRLSDFL